MSYGDHCTNCGRCCKAIPCSLGIYAYGDHRPCKALEITNEGKHICGLVRKPSDHLELGNWEDWKDEFLSEMFAHMLGIGMGCCSSPEGEAIHDRMRKFHKNGIAKKCSKD